MHPMLPLLGALTVGAILLNPADTGAICPEEIRGTLTFICGFWSSQSRS